MSFVKLAETYLISSAMPFLLSALFLRSRFQIENTEYTVLCIVSRLRADLLDLRFILSCSRLLSSPQCMLSIDQWLRTMAPNNGVSVGRLVTYSRVSVVRGTVDIRTVSDPYPTNVIVPRHSFLSDNNNTPSKMR